MRSNSRHRAERHSENGSIGWNVPGLNLRITSVVWESWRAKWKIFNRPPRVALPRLDNGMLDLRGAYVSGTAVAWVLRTITIVMSSSCSASPTKRAT